MYEGVRNTGLDEAQAGIKIAGRNISHLRYQMTQPLWQKVKKNWCTGTTQRDGMGREEGGGFRMGNTCITVADSF